MLDGSGQLVGAGGGLEPATDAFQFGDDVLGFHAFHQSGDTLCVAVAAAIELHILQNAILDFKLDGLAACSLGAVGVSHI